MPRQLRIEYPGAIYHVMIKTVCDYVHLNPVRAGLLGGGERLLSYPWSSLGWYLAVPKHRPGWLRVDPRTTIKIHHSEE